MRRRGRERGSWGVVLALSIAWAALTACAPQTRDGEMADPLEAALADAELEGGSSTDALAEDGPNADEAALADVVGGVTSALHGEALHGEALHGEALHGDAAPRERADGIRGALDEGTRRIDEAGGAALGLADRASGAPAAEGADDDEFVAEALSADDLEDLADIFAHGDSSTVADGDDAEPAAGSAGHAFDRSSEGAVGEGRPGVGGVEAFPRGAVGELSSAVESVHSVVESAHDALPTEGDDRGEEGVHGNGDLGNGDLGNGDLGNGALAHAIEDAGEAVARVGERAREMTGEAAAGHADLAGAARDAAGTALDRARDLASGAAEEVSSTVETAAAASEQGLAAASASAEGMVGNLERAADDASSAEPVHATATVGEAKPAGSSFGDSATTSTPVAAKGSESLTTAASLVGASAAADGAAGGALSPGAPSPGVSSPSASSETASGATDAGGADPVWIAVLGIAVMVVIVSLLAWRATR